MGRGRNQIIKGYAAAAEVLKQRYEEVSPEVLYAPVKACFPQNPCRILDIGAGTGRDAKWLTGLGHDVLAVEPVDEFRICTGAFGWLDDCLPDLSATRALGRKFDFILVNAVFQHVWPADRGFAMQSIAGVLAEGGRICMSLRHGPSVASRMAFALNPSEIVGLATRYGLQAVFQCETGSQSPP